ncbi:hypothetical protein HOG21_03990 [bacterium]|nr:hypothetical protein [bacterium]
MISVSSKILLNCSSISISNSKYSHFGDICSHFLFNITNQSFHSSKA